MRTRYRRREGAERFDVRGGCLTREQGGRSATPSSKDVVVRRHGGADS